MHYVLAVCDSEIEYAYQLVNYLENKKGFPFGLQLFTSLDTLLVQAKKQPVFIALISQKDYQKEFHFHFLH